MKNNSKFNKMGFFFRFHRYRFLHFYVFCQIAKLLLVFLLALLSYENANARSDESFSEDTEKLLLRLNLDNKNRISVKLATEHPEKAAAILLNYYRQRAFVNHPVKRIIHSESMGKTASEQDFKVANDALNHVFVGQPAYPPHFCGNDINWNTRPVPDNEWVWQLNRMSFWEAMGRVYQDTGDEKYAREWAYQLMDWIRKNPNDAEHKYAWRSIEAGIRGYRWTGLFQRFIDSPHFTPEVLVAFLNSFYDHADYLMTVYRSGSNWGLMEAEGMAFIAMSFPEFDDAEKWREEAFRRLNNEINIQVYPDGHQRELAIGYHLGCIRWFMHTYQLAKMNGIENAFPESYLEKIQKMCEVPMKIGLPDGTNVQFGDAWAGEPGQHAERFLEWSETFNRDDFLYLATRGKKGTPPEKTAFALKESGIYSMRSGWNEEAICLVLKCGPDGGGHCQPDNGTFDLYAGGRNLMPDAGSYIYSGDPEGRKWFRQTKVHQTLTLDGKNSQYAPELLKWQPGENLDILVVENASYENLTHRRSVFFVDKSYFVVVDEATGTGTGDVDIHFQLAPDAGVVVSNRDNNSFQSNFKDGWNVYIESQNQKGLKLEEEEGWVSFEYTKKQPRPAFRYRLKKSRSQDKIQFVTLVVPYKNEAPEIEITRTMVKSGKIEVEVLENGIRKIIGYNTN